MGLFRANNSVANFWMQFATISAYVVVASEVDMGWTERLLRTSFANSFFLESAIAASWLFYHQKPASASLISQESRYLQRRFLRLQNHLHLRIHPVLQDVDLSTESKVEPLTCQKYFCLTEYKSFQYTYLHLPSRNWSLSFSDPSIQTKDLIPYRLPFRFIVDDYY